MAAISPQWLLIFLPWFAFVALATLFIWLTRWIVGRRQPRPAQNLVELVRGPSPAFGLLTDALAGMFPDLFAYKLDRDLRRSGFYRPNARTEFLAWRNTLVAGTIVTALAWLIALEKPTNEVFWTIVVGGFILSIMGYSLPRLYLSWRGDRRAAKIVAGFPDALDSIVMALTGGLPLQSALDRVGTEIGFAHPELADELEIVRRQSFVSSLEQALQRLSDRIDEEPITALLAVVSHAEKLGADVASALCEYADQLRNSQLMDAAERGNRQSIKMLFPITLCLTPAAYILLMAPPLLDLKQFRDRETAGSGLLVQPNLQKLKQPSLRTPFKTQRQRPPKK